MTCFGTNATNTTFELDVTRLTFDVIILTLVITTNIAILTVALRRWVYDGFPYGYVLSSLLVVNLSATDLTVGISGIFYYLPRYYCALAERLAKSKNLCILRFAPNILGHLASGCTLVAIAGDRYLAVCFPLNYQNLTTPLRSICVIVVIWVLGLTGSMVLFAWNTWDGRSCSEADVIPMEFNLYVALMSHLIILTAVTTAHWNIHRKVLEVRKSRSFAEGNVVGGMHASDDRIGTRASRMLVLILCVYVVSWAPFMTALILVEAGVYVPNIVLDTASTFISVNYVVNPFIYAYNNRTIKSAIVRSVTSFKRKRIDPLNGVSNSSNYSRS